MSRERDLQREMQSVTASSVTVFAKTRDNYDADTEALACFRYLVDLIFETLNQWRSILSHFQY